MPKLHFIYHLKPAGILLAASIGLFVLAIGCMEEQQIDKSKKTPDDAISVLISGNWMGHLGPCGCSAKQLGGLDRRTEKINQIAPNKAARLLLDTGALIKQNHRQSQLKLQTFLHGMKILGYDAIGLSPSEIILLHETIDIDPAEMPSIICSNMAKDSRQTYSIEEYLKPTLKVQNRTLNCLIMSIANPGQIQDTRIKEMANLKDPVTSVKSILESNNIRTDQPSTETMVILMASDANESLINDLQKIKAIDMLVSHGFYDKPEKAKSEPDGPLTFTTGKMGKYLSHVIVPSKTSDNSADYSFSAVEILDTNKMDPRITSLFDDYQISMEAENLIDSGMPRLALPNPKDAFVGNKTCKECHEDIYKIWQKTKHSHAMFTLIDKNRNFDPECVACHSVGMQYETGYRSMDATPELAHVGCEMCHGPGKLHVNSSNNKPYPVKLVECEHCHDPENSPRFQGNKAQYLKDIRHW